MYLGIFTTRRARAAAAAAVLAGLTAVLAGLTAVAVPGTPAAAEPVCAGAERIAVRFSSVSCTFGYTGSQQTFRVPAGVYSATVVAIGGAGGANGAGGRRGTGGEGEQVMANIPTRPHQTLRVEVGGNGGNGTAVSGGHGGYNGGAPGAHGAGSPVGWLSARVRRARSTAGLGEAPGVRRSGSAAGGGGGGGASDVRRVSRLADGTLSTRLVVAAGGGAGAGAGGDGAGASGPAVRGIIVLDLGRTASPPSVTISFSEPGAPMVVTGPGLPRARKGHQYRARLTAAGGTGGYRWSLRRGALPAGLTLRPGGMLSGVPALTGVARFTVRVTGRRSGRATRSFTLKVAGGPVRHHPTATRRSIRAGAAVSGTGGWVRGAAAPASVADGPLSAGRPSGPRWARRAGHRPPTGIRARRRR